MDPFSGQGLGLGSARGWVAARAQLGAWVAWVGSVGRARGSVGRLVGLVRLGRVGCLGSGVGLVIGSGWQVIRSGRLGELLRGRGQNVKGLGVPNN
jgi:hypothetical protein